MLNYWLLPKISSQKKKRGFSFAYNIKHLRIQYWQPIHGLLGSTE